MRWRLTASSTTCGTCAPAALSRNTNEPARMSAGNCLRMLSTGKGAPVAGCEAASDVDFMTHSNNFARSPPRAHDEVAHAHDDDPGHADDDRDVPEFRIEAHGDEHGEQQPEPEDLQPRRKRRVYRKLGTLLRRVFPPEHQMREQDDHPREDCA